MPRIERTVTTTSDPETVWRFMSDFRSTEQWDPPTRSTVRESGDGGVGTVYRNVSRVLGHDVEIVYTVIGCEPPRLLRLRGESDSFTAVDTLEVRPRSGGSTVEYTADFEFEGAMRLAEPLAPLGLKKIGDDAAEQMARCLDGLPAGGASDDAAVRADGTDPSGMPVDNPSG